MDVFISSKMIDLFLIKVIKLIAGVFTYLLCNVFNNVPWIQSVQNDIKLY